MPKNIVICCDGTNNQFGANNTNVVRLVQALNRDPNEQIVYYDPGVGTLPEPGFVSRIGKRLSEVMGLAFGLGLTRKIGEAYSFLMDHYATGDAIYLFGFSRGAYTVRALAGVIHQFGLLPAGNHNLVPYVLRLSRAINRLPKSNTGAGTNYWKLTRSFRATFARTAPGSGAPIEHVRVHFLGVWDTVASVGWVWDPTHFAYTACNPCVEILRHAVAIDERRWFFRQNRWEDSNASGTQDVKQLWFPGVHCDIGGGYREDDPKQQGGLWRVAFVWMLREALEAGLKIDTKKLREILHRTPITRPAWASQVHNSLRWYWWPAEFFPKFPRYKDQRAWCPRLGLFRPRNVKEGELIHRAALRRIRRTDLIYQPPNLTPAFQQYVRNLCRLPEALPYRSHPV